jgi:hypothetical protein
MERNARPSAMLDGVVGRMHALAGNTQRQPLAMLESQNT